MKNTPHIKPDGKRIAQTVLLPGDPLRAKFIAETYLEKAVQFNAVRNMFGYTGLYKGKEVSVMGTGMGSPSMGIYSYELIHFFGAKNLIRIGSCGSLQENIKLFDIVFALGASTSSNFAQQLNVPGTFSATASWDLLKKATDAARKKSVNVRVGNILSSDVFYGTEKENLLRWKSLGVLGVEMETFALYLNAAFAQANALSILTVSDHVLSGEVTSPEEREKSFTKMMEIALDVAIDS